MYQENYRQITTLSAQPIYYFTIVVNGRNVGIKHKIIKVIFVKNKNNETYKNENSYSINDSFSTISNNSNKLV